MINIVSNCKMYLASSSILLQIEFYFYVKTENSSRFHPNKGNWIGFFEHSELSRNQVVIVVRIRNATNLVSSKYNFEDF